MIGVLLPERLEDFRGLQLQRVGLVGRQRCLIERERIENTRFDIVAILALHGLHRLRVGERAIAMRDGRRVGVELIDGGEIRLLARRRMARRQPLLRGRQAALEQRPGLDAGERIAPLAQRDAPVRDRAIRIAAKHLVEHVDRGTELERMHEAPWRD